MEETRLRDIDRVKSGTESSSLGSFNSYFYSECGPAFGKICTTGEQLESATGQGILRQEGRQRGPGGMLLNLG